MQAFGIIPLYREHTTWKVLLVHTTTDGSWEFSHDASHPEDESFLATAYRGLKKQTGITKIDLDLDTTQMFQEVATLETNEASYNKDISYCPGFIKKKPDVSMTEINLQNRWVTLEEAEDLLAPDGSKAVLKEVRKYLQHHDASQS